MALRVGQHRHRRSGAMAGKAMFASAVALIGLLFLTWLWLPKGVCATVPSALYAILLDSTSHLSEAQRLDLGNRLRRYMAEMPAGALVQFWTVAPSGQGVPAAMAEPICKPDPDPNAWIQNENRAKRALAEFNDAISRRITEALESQERPESPILEGVQAIWLRFLGSDRYEDGMPRRLVIASDLVQHTQAMSFYRRLPAARDLERNERYQDLRVPLSGTEIEILYLKQDDGIDAGRLVELWQWMLGDMGAVLNRVVRITG